jgi:hypothetical protein
MPAEYPKLLAPFDRVDTRDRGARLLPRAHPGVLSLVLALLVFGLDEAEEVVAGACSIPIRSSSTLT